MFMYNKNPPFCNCVPSPTMIFHIYFLQFHSCPHLNIYHQQKSQHIQKNNPTIELKKIEIKNSYITTNSFLERERIVATYFTANFLVFANNQYPLKNRKK